MNLIKEFFRFTSKDIIGIVILAFFMFFSFLFLGMFGILTPASGIINIIYYFPQILNLHPVLYLIVSITATLITLYLLYCTFGFLRSNLIFIKEIQRRKLAKLAFYSGLILFFIFPLSIHSFDSGCWSPVGLCDGSNYRISNIKLGNAWAQGCNDLKLNYECEVSKISSIATIDITGDGITDNLLNICRAKFEDPTLTSTYCRNKCCNNIIQEGSECENDDDKDCQFGFGKSSWICTNNHCCPLGNIWENGVCIEK